MMAFCELTEKTGGMWMTCGETVPVLGVECVGAGWGDGVMKSHERWKSPIKNF
jgi:hypothetical protein